jgi:hypothetical protein
MSHDFVNYQSALPLINRIRETLDTYDAAGLIDDSQFYDWIKVEMQSLGLGYYRQTETILDVRNYRAETPRTLVSLHGAYRCGNATAECGVNTYKIEKQPKYFYIEDCEINIAKAPCKNYEYFGKLIKRTYQFPELKAPVIISQEIKHPLRLTNRARVPLCTEDCINLRSSSSDEFTLDENYFTFNFSEDQVFIQYFELPVDEFGLPQIPDIFSVKESIEKLILFKLFKKWYYNNQGDVLQRMQFAEREYNAAHQMAIKEVKLPSYKELIDYATRRRDRNDRFQLFSKAFGRSV